MTEKIAIASQKSTTVSDDIRSFIQRHGRAYDAETDNYDVDEPFDRDIRAGKNSAIYYAHKYLTKIPPLGIVPILEHYSKEGDIILDPFCGSGMTGVAALLCGRSSVLSDLSPVAIHLSRNYCTPCDTQRLRTGFDRIKVALKEEFDWL